MLVVVTQISRWIGLPRGIVKDSSAAIEELNKLLNANLCEGVSSRHIHQLVSGEWIAMGQGKRRRDAFLKAHPRCAFCGGGAIATTIEHCPPRGFFQDRAWPEGFEFPACEPCNKGTGDVDLLIALLGRMDPVTQKGDLDGRRVGLMRAVNAQYPGLLGRMMPRPREARRSNRERGIVPAEGQTHQVASGTLTITDEVHNAVCLFGSKLAKAIWYSQTKNIFPDHGTLWLHWFTNVDLQPDGNFPVFEALREMPGNSPPLVRSRKYLNDQFEHKTTITDNDTMALQVRFGNSFGFVVFGSTVDGKLERVGVNLRERTGLDNPFTILQAPR